MQRLDPTAISDFYITLANAGDPEEDDGMTNLKLNKLLFLTQAASLQRYGRTLFDTPIEAWKYGPVVHPVYEKYKEYGRDSIPTPKNGFDWRTLDPGILNLLCDVYAAYAVDYTGTGLMRLTHMPGTPWSDVYEPGENRIISPQRILQWVSAHPLRTDTPPMPERMVEQPSFTPDGEVMLPADWMDD